MKQITTHSKQKAKAVWSYDPTGVTLEKTNDDTIIYKVLVSWLQESAESVGAGALHSRTLLPQLKRYAWLCFL
jgi:hypothetical protein